MFLVNHSHEIRARELRTWLARHPSIALVVAATYFEWTVSRAIIALSRRPNAEVRASFRSVFGLEKYKKLWADELAHLPGAKRLPEVVRDWQAVVNSFDARNRLVHGRARYTKNMAAPAVESLIDAVSDVGSYCRAHGIDLNRRLPVRMRHRSSPSGD
jgi:hypothetical protein